MTILEVVETEYVAGGYKLPQFIIYDGTHLEGLFDPQDVQ